MVEKKKEKAKMKQIGIPGIKPPTNSCDDVNCPYHGTIGVRGRTFEGVVLSTKPSNTAIVKWNRRKFFPRYERFEKSFTKVTAHLPKCIDVHKGDTVIIGECRPISKTKKFTVIQKVGEE